MFDETGISEIFTLLGWSHFAFMCDGAKDFDFLNQFEHAVGIRPTTLLVFYFSYPWAPIVLSPHRTA